MKAAATDFALFGGPKEFDQEIPVGQLYFPEWNRYEKAIRSIIVRRFYTNHGPLVRELELRLEAYFGVRNAISVTNGTIGLYLVALALGLKGKILMPAFTFAATAEAAILAGLEPVFCDVEAETHHISARTVNDSLPLMNSDGVGALCAVNLWGGCADISALTELAREQSIPLFFDSAHGAGVETAEGKLGGFGRAEVFSFHATKLISATEGGCICTNDDELAERIRNMRSNYGIRRPVEVPLTVNARMSEAQAAIALASLEDVDRNISHNREAFEQYRSDLMFLPGIRFFEPTWVTKSNYQSAVLEIAEEEFGLSRDRLWELLRSEGVFARRYFRPGLHRLDKLSKHHPEQVDLLPETDGLSDRILQLPIGQLVSTEKAGRICGLIRDAHAHCKELQRHA